MRIMYRPVLFLLILVSPATFSQERSFLDYSLETQSVISSKALPFWLRSNQSGSIPLPEISNSIIPRIEKRFSEDAHNELWNWSGAIETRMNFGKSSNVRIIEAYLKGRIGPIELNVGRSRGLVGYVDSTLSSGSFAVSGNALGIPKIEISVPHFFVLPVFRKALAVKGNFIHGWMGNVPITIKSIGTARTYFHQKSFYVRVGRLESKVKLIGGFNQEVIWGDEKKIFNAENFNLNRWNSFLYVLTGKNYYTGGKSSVSHVGNQLGSIDLGGELSFKNGSIKVYRQNFYEKGALYYLANLRDGLNGISITNNNSKRGSFWAWNKVVFEVLNTKNQGGESWSPWTPSGPEQYYNHGVYSEGYSYNSLSLGTPFITPKKFARAGQASDLVDFFINNRLFLVHFGFEGKFINIKHVMKVSYSNNYGTYWTSHNKYFWFNGERVPHIIRHGVFQKVNQFSFYLEGIKEFKHGITIGYVGAFDKGALLNNSVGFMLKLKKNFSDL